MVQSNLAPTLNMELAPRNRLLAALPHDAFWQVRSHLKPATLTRGSVLCEPDEPLGRVYFMESGAISLVTVFEDGATAEMATVGREGVVGIGTLLGHDHGLARYVVPLSGFAYAIEAARFRAFLHEVPALRAVCESYARAFVGNLLQNVACNACHHVEQRCARFLLMCADLADDAAIELTQEYLAEMLGVRRSTVTVVAGGLQKAGLIRYHRGAIEVVDRRGLETVACECYRIVRDGYERALIHAIA